MVNGGSIALGHPLGATGAILLGTALDEIERRGLEQRSLRSASAAVRGLRPSSKGFKRKGAKAQRGLSLRPCALAPLRYFFLRFYTRIHCPPAVNEYRLTREVGTASDASRTVAPARSEGMPGRPAGITLTALS